VIVVLKKSFFMLPLSRFNIFAVILCSLILIAGCKKIDSPGNNPPPPNNNPPGGQNPPSDSTQPVVTAVGTPVGSPVTKTIGPSGGSISSDDGKVQLTIPAGALAANTDITVQPVTNEVPGGIGLSYDFLPNGTKFSKPATLIFHYTDDDMMGNDPVFLCLAYQDSSNQWKTNLQQQYLDSTAKTLSLDISHFTIWSVIDLGIIFEASPKTLKANETSRIHVFEVLEQTETLNSAAQVPDAYVTNWQVNSVGLGVGTDNGTIEGSGSAVTYKAPAQIPTTRIVRVSAHMKINLTIYYRGRRIDFPNGFDEGVNITLLSSQAEYKYTISMAIVDSSISPYYGGPLPNQPVYHDRATFDLKIKLNNGGITYDTSNLHNEAPTVTPATGTYDNEDFIWIPDSYGIINVAGISQNWFGFPEDSVLEFSVQHSHATFWGFMTQSSKDGTLFTKSEPQPYGGSTGFPQLFQVDLKRREAYFDPSQLQFGGGLGRAGAHISVAVAPQ
jgi:hypothetical protein